LFNRWAGFLEVTRNHCWSYLNAGIEGQEPGFRNGRYLRRIAHVDNQYSSSLAIFTNEIRRCSRILGITLKPSLAALLPASTGIEILNRNRIGIPLLWDLLLWNLHFRTGVSLGAYRRRMQQFVREAGRVDVSSHSYNAKFATQQLVFHAGAVWPIHVSHVDGQPLTKRDILDERPVVAAENQNEQSQA
jgi:hypothetical protein